MNNTLQNYTLNTDIDTRSTKPGALYTGLPPPWSPLGTPYTIPNCRLPLVRGGYDSLPFDLAMRERFPDPGLTLARQALKRNLY